jgi:hypothetical protein
MKKVIIVTFMILIVTSVFVLPCFGDVINGCYQKSNGLLRIVKGAAKCRPSEVFIQWNQVGPPGPPGPPGPILDCSTPPTISYQYSCVGSILNIDLNIVGNKEIAYYAIQEQGGDPPTNTITFVGPGLTSVNYQLSVEPRPNTRTLLFVASDTCGNTGKSLLEIEPNICSDFCTDNSQCPGITLYCSKPVGDCVAQGTCSERPSACALIFNSVCGCDGITYGNACLAAQAGVNVAGTGPCP